MIFTPSVEATLKWLQAEVDDEIKDRTQDPEDDWIDRAMVSSESRVTSKLENSDLQSSKSAGLASKPRTCLLEDTDLAFNSMSSIFQAHFWIQMVLIVCFSSLFSSVFLRFSNC